MTNPQLRALYTAGVSIWLDDLSRSLIKNGQLAQLIDVDSVTGVTTNPSIFHAALSHLSPNDSYTAQIQELAKLGADVDTTIRTITTDDVRDACDIFAPVFEKTAGLDGRVSIEVDPRLANDTDQTIAQAISLWKIVDRPNLLIKIPATTAGIPAITKVIAEGISVNVTLIFSVQRYKDVIDAYIQGLREAQRNGHDLTKIFSVASFFVSRVDTEIDKRLEKINTPQAHALKGKAALANARLAYKLFQELFHSDVFGEFAGIAHIQRPLWASTGVKNPEYPDTLYVGELVAPHTVNTMPEKTLRAFADHGVVHADSITANYDEAAEVFAHLTEVGIDLEDVFTLLEQEGVDKFVQAWQELLTTTDEQLHKYKK